MYTKLSNGAEYINPHFPIEFAEFMLSNGFRCWVDRSTIFFEVREKKLLRVNGAMVDYYVYNPDPLLTEPQRWSYDNSFLFLNTINFFGWLQLLHQWKVITLLSFMRNAKAAGLQEFTEASSILKSIEKSG